MQNKNLTLIFSYYTVNVLVINLSGVCIQIYCYIMLHVLFYNLLYCIICFNIFHVKLQFYTIHLNGFIVCQLCIYLNFYYLSPVWNF